jgi:hypothetical protein
MKTILNILYFFHCIVSIIIAGILAFVNFSETCNLFLGRSTKIYISTLSYNQEVLFRVFSSIVFIILIIMLCKAVTIAERKRAMIISVFIYLFVILIMYVDFSTTLKGP